MAEKQPIGLNEPAPDGFVGHVKITNFNDFELEDRWDGRVYTFKCSTPTTIPVEVARHIFGFGLPEKDQENYVMRRFGWNTVEMTKDRQNLKYFKALDIRPVMFRMVEVAGDENEETERPHRSFEVTKRGPGRPPKYPPMITNEGEGEEKKTAS